MFVMNEDEWRAFILFRIGEEKALEYRKRKATEGERLI